MRYKNYYLLLLFILLYYIYRIKCSPNYIVDDIDEDEDEDDNIYLLQVINDKDIIVKNYTIEYNRSTHFFSNLNSLYSL